LTASRSLGKQDRDEPRGGAVVGALVVALVAVAFQLPIFDRWFSHMDEGHVLLFSDLIAKGGDLYRDATLYPLPGAFYLLAQFFKVFGSSILVSRWIVMLEFAGFVALLWVLMRGAVSRGPALAVVALLLLYRIWAFPHWQVYSYSTTCLLFIVIAVLCELRYFTTRRLGWLGAAGLLFGVAVYCKQDYGAVALLVMASVLVIEARVQPAGREARVATPLAVFVGAGAAVGAVVGAYFFYHGLLGELVQQTVLNHIRGIGTFEYTTYPAFWPLFTQDPAIRDGRGLFAFFPGIVTTVDLETLRQNWLFRETFVYDVALKLFFWGPYAFAAFAVVRLARTRNALESVTQRDAWLREAMLAGFCVGFMLLVTLNRPQDFLHVAVLYWPFLCLLGVYARGWLAGPRAVLLVLALVLLVPTVAVVGYSVRGYVRLLAQNTEPIAGERSGIRAKPAEAALMRDIETFIHESTAPDETVAVVPYFPIVHFLADRVGPDRSAYIVWPFAEFADRDQRIIDSIEAQGTDTAIYNFTQFSTFPPMHEFAPDLFEHLVRNFEMVRVFSYDQAGFMLGGLRRSERSAGEGGADATVSLLDEHWGETGVWIESDEQPPLALSPARRGEYAARELWPFRPVLALRPSSGGERTVFQIPIDVRTGDVVRTAIGVHPGRWFTMPAYAVHFAVMVQVGQEREPLYVQTLDPHVEFADRGWFDVELPLDDYAGQRIELQLTVEVDSAAGESRMMGGFSEPVLLRAEALDVEAEASGVADSQP
jgi:hypothetical protein